MVDELTKMEQYVNKKWQDKVSSTDEMLLLLGQLLVRNTRAITNIEKILGSGEISGFENTTGSTGIATTSASDGEKISIVTGNHRTITGIANGTITQGEPAFVGGGSVDRPDIYPSSQLFRGKISGTNKIGKSEIDDIGRLISTSASDQNFAVILNNPTFSKNSLDGWSYSGDGSVEIDKQRWYTDNASAKATVDKDKVLNIWNDKLLRVAPETTLNVSGYYRKNGDLTVYTLVRYFNANQKLITTNYEYEHLFRKPLTDEINQDGQWYSVLRNPAVPPNASYAQVGVKVIGNEDNANFWIDNVSSPVYTPIEKQFYYTTDKYTKRYISAGEEIYLHEGDYGTKGNIVEVWVDVNSPNAILEFELDGLVEEYYLGMFNHDLVWRPNTISLLSSDTSKPNSRDNSWKFIWESDSMFSFNYRMSVKLKNPEYLPVNAPEEIIAVGDSSTSNFTGTLDNYPIYTTDTKETYLSITDGVEVFIDNGDGTLTGSEGGSGTINYETGEYDINFNTAPENNQDITSIYTYLSPNSETLVLHGGFVNKQIYL